jgi:hypothetical protein
MNGVCSTNEVDEKCTILERLIEKDPLEDLGIDGRL